MDKGKFITFEGCEGSGKSTQIALFKKYLDEKFIDYVFTREPGGTPISEKIRDIILNIENSSMTMECEALLYAAARVQHIKEKIIPSIENGKLVFCDRYLDSSFAYQAYARGLGLEFISQINSYAINYCMPDFTVFLNISPDDAFKRKGGADLNDRLETAGMEFHRKVFNGYKELIKKYPERFIVIDCSGNKFETHEKIIMALKERGIL